MDWTPIVTGLLSGGGIGAMAGALEQTMMFINHLTADNPEKRLKARVEWLKLLEDCILKAKEAKNVAELNKVISDINTLGESK